MKKVIVTSLLLIAPLCNAMNYGGIELVNEDAWDVVRDTISYAVKQIKCEVYRASLFGSHSLNFSRQEIEAMPTYLPNLVSLFLNNNKLKELPADPHLPRLSELQANNNLIQEFPNHMHFPALRDLELRNNRLQNLPAGLIRLQCLNLSGNCIREVSANLNLPNLKDLNLYDNTIYFIDPGVLEQFKRLSRLNLGKNHLQKDNIVQLRKYAKEHNITICLSSQEPVINIRPAKR